MFNMAPTFTAIIYLTCRAKAWLYYYSCSITKANRHGLPFSQIELHYSYILFLLSMQKISWFNLSSYSQILDTHMKFCVIVLSACFASTRSFTLIGLCSMLTGHFSIIRPFLFYTHYVIVFIHEPISVSFCWLIFCMWNIALLIYRPGKIKHVSKNVWNTSHKIANANSIIRRSGYDIFFPYLVFTWDTSTIWDVNSVNP